MSLSRQDSPVEPRLSTGRGLALSYCRVGLALVDDLRDAAVHRRVNRQLYMRQLGSMPPQKSSALFRPLSAVDVANV